MIIPFDHHDVPRLDPYPFDIHASAAGPHNRDVRRYLRKMPESVRVSRCPPYQMSRPSHQSCRRLVHPHVLPRGPVQRGAGLGQGLWGLRRLTHRRAVPGQLTTAPPDPGEIQCSRFPEAAEAATQGRVLKNLGKPAHRRAGIVPGGRRRRVYDTGHDRLARVWTRVPRRLNRLWRSHLTMVTAGGGGDKGHWSR